MSTAAYTCPVCGRLLLYQEKGFACPGGWFCVSCGLYCYREDGSAVPGAVFVYKSASLSTGSREGMNE